MTDIVMACRECDGLFNEGDASLDHEGGIFCPYCGSEQIEIADEARLYGFEQYNENDEDEEDYER